MLEGETLLHCPQYILHTDTLLEKRESIFRFVDHKSQKKQEEKKFKMNGWMLVAAVVLGAIYAYFYTEQDHQKTNKKEQRKSENGSNKSPEGTKTPPSSYQSKPVLSESSSVTSNQRRSSSFKAAKPTATDSQSPSFFKSNPPISSKPTLSPLHSNSIKKSENGSNKSPEGTMTPPSSGQSKTVLSQSSSVTSDQPRSSSVKAAKPTATESQSPSFFKSSPAISSKPTLSQIPYNSTNQPTIANYTLVGQNDTLPIYMIPKDIENLIKEDIVPDVLKKPLSPATYKDYFASLLYAEDLYYEKWSKFQLLNVQLELHEAAIYDESLNQKSLKEIDQKSLKGSRQKEGKFFVAFKIDSVPEKRPFLLSRDFVFAQRSGSKSKKYQGLLYRVVKSTTVLVEFEKDFYSQHHSNHRYDISFSFNRVCLKRAHQAIASASDPLFKNFLFPDCVSRMSIPSSSPCLYSNYILDWDSNSALRQILRFEGQPPYLVEGPLSVTRKERIWKNDLTTEFVLSKTGIVVQGAVLEIYQRSPESRVLLCAPSNTTCDLLMGSLKGIPESYMFRANAAFREVDGVPEDILPLCPRKGECFSCPSLQGLRQYRVIFSTFVSSFRLHDSGITAGHFSHIFLVDASSAIEPEIMISLSNFANENTTVIVTGAPGNYPNWVRSYIGRMKGLKTSYFERLRKTKTYQSSNPEFLTQLSS